MQHPEQVLQNPLYIASQNQMSIQSDGRAEATLALARLRPMIIDVMRFFIRLFSFVF
jgi:hypothetical protein